MEFRVARKRGRPSTGLNGNNGFKKSKQDTESFQSGLGSKSKPCTKFFSTYGCPFGEGCHFAHYIPVGIKGITQMTGGNPPSSPNGSSPPAVKSRLCTKYNTAEGCRFGDKYCHFAHGEWQLGKPIAPSHHEPAGPASGPAAFGTPDDHGFGASATAKISVMGTLAGRIIGKNGVNSKQICRLTGVKLSIPNHESDPNLKNIELEGTFDQIKQASQMIRELILSLSSSAGLGQQQQQNFGGSGGGAAAANFKTKLCDNFAKGSCPFGERCHFAHGTEELRTSSGV